MLLFDHWRIIVEASDLMLLGTGFVSGVGLRTLDVLGRPSTCSKGNFVHKLWTGNRLLNGGALGAYGSVN
jgi:hypothetical protein